MPSDAAFEPDTPREWLRIASEDLALARARVPGVGYGLLCFHAQQAAEKAIKAVLIARNVAYPYVHDIGRLLHLARSNGVGIPTEIEDADLLTDYVTLGRYPGLGEISESDFESAVTAANAVVMWALGIIDAE